MIFERPHAILLDVGGTLLETLENPQHVALRSIADLGVVDPIPFATTLDAVVKSWWAAGGTAETEDLGTTWTAHYQRVLEQLGFPGDAAVAAKRMEDGFLSSGWRVFPEVPGVLETLSELAVPLGIVSNWPPTLAKTLERAGLRDYFRVVIASGEVGYAKPNPRIFELAAAALGVAPGRILYVGDDPRHDVQGATDAGMEALLLDRDGRWPDHPRRLSSLGELRGLVHGRTDTLNSRDDG